MWIDVALDHASARVLCPKVWIAVDVLRATSVMTTFLSEGGTDLYMTADVEEARKLQRQFNLLAMGEQFAKPIAGFDFDNSPLALLRAKEKLKGRGGVHSTSNGTKLVKLLTSLGGHVLAGCFLNLGACVDRAATLVQRESSDVPRPPEPKHLDSDGLVHMDDPDGIVIACAGRAGMPILDDTYCAGALVDGLVAHFPHAELRDGAMLAQAVRRALPVEETFVKSESGQVMAALGLQEEILFCARQDIYSCVPQASFRGDHLVMRASRNGVAHEAEVSQAMRS
jgi:phosphosulfolactate phosphohydrolase-like enzyme